MTGVQTCALPISLQLWEHFCHLLAKRAGITVADTRVLQTSETYHTLISRRFDRTEQGRRIHFASAMTLLGLHDGDNAMNGYGYLDIVDFIVRHCADIVSDKLSEFRRAYFSQTFKTGYFRRISK